MKKNWVRLCKRVLAEPAAFYSQGSRKILRGFHHTFDSFERDLTLKDIGYSKQKLTRLKKLYLHEESVEIAADLYKYLINRGKYSSACFTTYNHFIKAGAGSPNEKRNTRSPCLQGITLTLMRDGKDRTTSVDVFYRTTELFKKFPADLLLIRGILDDYFDLDDAPLKDVTFHFANLTCHPMYITTVLPHVKNPIKLLRDLEGQDKIISQQTYKWVDRYLNGNEGVDKFRQARAVKTSFHNSFTEEQLEELHRVCKGRMKE